MTESGIDGWYRAESGRATFAFRVEGGEVVEAAPYGKFIMGLRWGTAYMKLEQGGFTLSRINITKVDGQAGGKGIFIEDVNEHPLAPQSFEPSLVRRALDYLLDAYPMFDLVSIDWQFSHDFQSHGGPWLLVTLGQPSADWDTVPAWAIWRFAIWKTTGALHTMKDGAVSDDPIWTP